MKSCCLLLLALLHTAAAETLPFHRKGALVILPDVYLNGQGPFHMMLDTGGAASTIRVQTARRLALTPQYAVEQVTAAGVRRAPAICLDEVRTGAVSQHSVEFVIAGGLPSGVDGILGQSWLLSHDYLLDYRNRKLVLEGDPPATGLRLGLRSIEGRPAIPAVVDGHTTELVLDSGADMLVLSGAPFLPSATLFTSNGAVAASLGKARVALASEPARLMAAARVDGPLSGALMPLHLFAAVYVSNRNGFVVLVR